MKFLWIECKRAFFSIKFIIGIIGVSFIQLFSIYKISGINESVYSTYDILVCLISFFSCIIFCAIPYAQSFCEDFESNYIQQLLLRLNLQKYILFRICSICVSSNITMILGTILFVLIIHFEVPWISRFDFLDGDFIIKCTGNNYVLYYIIRAFYFGLPASCMSLLSAYASLFWKNKIFVLSMPFLIYCIMTFYVKDIFSGIVFLDVNKIFNPLYNFWGNAYFSLIWPIILSVLFVCILSLLIYKKLRCICYEKN